MIKEIKITDKMLLSARKKAKELGRLHNSISKGKGNLCGFLGEEVAMKVLRNGEINNTPCLAGLKITVLPIIKAGIKRQNVSFNG